MLDEGARELTADRRGPRFTDDRNCPSLEDQMHAATVAVDRQSRIAIFFRVWSFRIRSTSNYADHISVGVTTMN